MESSLYDDWLGAINCFLHIFYFLTVFCLPDLSVIADISHYHSSVFQFLPVELSILALFKAVFLGAWKYVVTIPILNTFYLKPIY